MFRLLSKVGVTVFGVATIAASPFLNASDPEVIHRFTVQVPTGADGEQLGLNPNTPPVYNPLDGKIYGVTQMGGGGAIPQFAGTYSVNYSFTPGAEESDFIGQGNPLGVVAGFASGLVVDSKGTVFGGAGPLSSIFGAPLLFSWPFDGNLQNALPDIDTSVYADAFKLRGLFSVDQQDNIYFGGGSGRTGMALYQRAADGTLKQLVSFALNEYVQGEGNSSVFLKGQFPAATVFSETDQVLYGIAAKTQEAAGSGDPSAVPVGDIAAGTLFKIAAADFSDEGTSTIEILHTFAMERDGRIIAADSGQSSLIEDGDWLYGISDAVVWRFNKTIADSFSVIHTFGVDTAYDANDQQLVPAADGLAPSGPLVLALDGNIYGTTLSTGESGNGAGSLFRIVTGEAADRSDDRYQQLYQFDFVNGSMPRGLSVGPTNSQNNTQILYGATGNGGGQSDAGVNDGFGVLFQYAVSVPEGHLSFSASAEKAIVGNSFTLSWNATHVSDCQADGDWLGSKPNSSSETLNLDTQGSYSFTLNCTDLLGETTTETITVDIYSAAVINFSSDQETIEEGKSITLTWSSESAENCTASENWNGTKEASGSETLSPDAVGEKSFVLTCEDAMGEPISKSVDVTVTAKPNESSGSGGGASGAWTLFILLVLLAQRSRLSIKRI